jgi:uncharacterized protein
MKDKLGNHIHLDSEDKKNVISSGIELTEKNRSASFFQQDNQVLIAKTLSESVDILSTEDALKKYPEVKDYYGRSFKSLGKDFPEDTEGGYFIRVKKGKKVTMPIQTCLFLKAQGFKQRVHNIIIIEEGAQAHLITGCAASRAEKERFHLGISEFYVKKGGYLNFTMIHSWEKDVQVKPLSLALVEEGGTFISNYVCLRQVREVVMYPTAVLEGKGAKASFSSLILSFPQTFQDIGSRVIFKAEDTQAEIVSRAVSLGGKVIARGHLQSKSKKVKAHLECRGLLVKEEGRIHAIPELETEFSDVDMSHEAAIGRVRKEEIEYLCSRGLNKEQAQSVIIRGFMDVDILGLPDILQKEINELEEKTFSQAL